MNGRLIARRRLELGLSRSGLSRLTGLNWDLLEALERSGEPPFVTLDAARRIASALGVDLDAIATRRDKPLRTPDDVRLEQLLARTRAAHAEAALAFAFDWPLRRLTQATRRLEQRLVNTGHALQRSNHGIRLIARGSEQASHDLARLRSRETSITKSQAELLRIAIIGTGRQQWPNFDADQRADAAKLCEHGLVEASVDQLRLSEDARFSLRPQLRHTATASVMLARERPPASTVASD